jgi:hypothetical protein
VRVRRRVDFCKDMEEGAFQACAHVGAGNIGGAAVPQIRELSGRQPP